MNASNNCWYQILSDSESGTPSFSVVFYVKNDDFHCFYAIYDDDDNNTTIIILYVLCICMKKERKKERKTNNGAFTNREKYIV